MYFNSKANVVILCAFLSACHLLVPIHPGTWLVGSIMNVDGLPISNARVSLYGTTVNASTNGCFKLQLPDALPFTFEVTAIGYKRVEMKASPGFFRVEAKLVRDDSFANSSAEWIEITEVAYHSSKPCA